MALVKEWEEYLARFIWSNCVGYLWNHTNITARKFWPGIRCLWWYIRSSLYHMGMED